MFEPQTRDGYEKTTHKLRTMFSEGLTMSSDETTSKIESCLCPLRIIILTVCAAQSDSC